MKCVVKDCQNHEREGAGLSLVVDDGVVTWICRPCWDFIVSGSGKSSQLHRNAHKPTGPQKLEDLASYSVVAGIGPYAVVHATGVFYAVDRGLASLPLVKTMRDKNEVIQWIADARPAFWIELLKDVVKWDQRYKQVTPLCQAT